LGARLSAWRLDHALAGGACPDTNLQLSLRASTLISPKVRRRLSSEIHAILDAAERPAHPLDRRLPMSVGEVARAGSTLEELAEELSAGGPVDPRGVALTRILLRDGNGPLYNDLAAGALEQTVQAAIDTMHPGRHDVPSG
jgi:hypothetical protein